MFRRVQALVLMGVLLLLAGCVHMHHGGDVVLATIDHVPITQSEFEQYVRSGLTGANMTDIRVNPAARKHALEAFFDLKVMAAKARQEGIDHKPKFQKAIQLMKMKLLVAAITDRDRAKLLELAKDPSGAGKRKYMENVEAEVGLKPTALATNDSPLVFTWVIKTNAVLATIGGQPVRESDFRWFLNDAFRPEERGYVFGRPGARKSLLHGYLSMRALAAKARQDGLDQTESFRDKQTVMHDKLLADFLKGRDHKMPWELTGNAAENEKAQRKYLDQMRADLHFKYASAMTASNALPRSSPVHRDRSSGKGL